MEVLNVASHKPNGILAKSIKTKAGFMVLDLGCFVAQTKHHIFTIYSRNLARKPLT